MVRALGRDHVASAGVGARQPQRQVVGLAAGADQEHPLERRRQQLDQPLGEARHALVEEPGVGVEQAQRASGGCGHGRMAVPEHGHVVDHVQVGAAVGVVEVMAPAAHDLRRAGGSRAPARRPAPGGAARAGRRGRAAAPPPRRRAAARDRGTAPARRRAETASPIPARDRTAPATAARAGAAPAARRPRRRCRRHHRLRSGLPARGHDALEQQPERLAAGSAQRRVTASSPSRSTSPPSGCPHRLAGRGEHVDAEVHGGRLGRARLAASVQPRLAVAADRRIGAGGLTAARTPGGRRHSPNA